METLVAWSNQACKAVTSPMADRHKWEQFEREKRKIQQENLPPAEYERRIRALAKRLKI